MHSAKTAVSFIRYRGEQVVAVLDSTVPPQCCQDLLQVGGGIPVIQSLEEAPEANTLIVGVAPSGGRMPEEMRRFVLEAIGRGMTIEAGMHHFLCDDPEFSEAARRSGATLKDIRKNNEKDVSTRQGIRPDCLRIHTVGNDCSVGKMVVSIELARALAKAGAHTKFVATGQTGILIEGDGCPVDCVVSDFVNGAAEKLVLANQHHDVLVIEGQGSLGHPRYSAVTLGLLHGVMPHGLIFCYEAGRETTKGMAHVPLPARGELMELYLRSAGMMHPCEFVGVAVNSRQLDDAQYEEEKSRVAGETGLPVCDVLREGAEPLVQAVLALRKMVLG